MSYTADFSLALGPAFTGLADLRAQLVDTTGASVGGAVSTGFTEIGNGFYLWHYTAFPDSHRGGVKFYQNSIPGTFLAFSSINPEELENTNIKSSTIAASAATALDSTIVSGTYDYGDALRVIAASQGGLLSGAGTGTVAIGDLAQTKGVITATVDASGNRSAITIDATP